MMTVRRRGAPKERELAAFADGSLPAPQRGRIERALSESSELRASVAAQQRALAAIDAAARERAPRGLRTRVRLAQPPDRRRGRSLGLVLAPAVALAAVVVAVVLSLGGGAVSPTVAQAAVLIRWHPQAPVHQPGGTGGALSGVQSAGLSYPYWEDQFGYRAMGMRSDELSGRRVTTVFYKHGSSQVAYEIVSGAPLAMGTRMRSTTQDGVRAWVASSHREMVVSWRRHGHTCILIGSHTHLAVLLHLAAWHDGGQVAY